MKVRSGLALLALLFPAVAAAQGWEDYDYENLQFRGLGVELGWVVPAAIEAAPSFGVRADMGFVGPRVRVSPSLRFWSSSLQQEEVDRLAEQILQICARQAATGCPSSLDLGDVRRSDLELSADGHYVFGNGTTATPYTGVGLSLHLLNGRGEFIDDTFVEDLLDSVAPGLNLLAGLNLPLGRRLAVLTEARAVITSDVRYANLVLGASWTLPSPPPATPAAP